MPVCGIYIYMCLTFISWGVHIRLDRLDFKNGIRKPSLDILYSLMKKKTVAKDWICLVNSCRKKDTDVLFKLNYSIISTLALDVVQVLESRNYFQSC